MLQAIPTDLLLRLMNATPEQYAAVERVLGMKDNGSKAVNIEHSTSNFEPRTAVTEDVVRAGVARNARKPAAAKLRVNAAACDADVIQRLGRLAFRDDFADVWLGDQHFDLRRRAKARACLRYLVAQRAVDANSARDLTQEIDPYVRAHCQLPTLPGYGELKIHHYFNPSTSEVARLGRELIRPAGRNGRYFLNVQ